MRVRIVSAIALGLFLLAALVQLNDPDPGVWIVAYLIAAGTAGLAMFGRTSQPMSGLLAAVYAVAAWASFPHVSSEASLGLSGFGMASLGVEEMRESLGLGICAVWTGYLAIQGEKIRALAAVGIGMVAIGTSGCAATTPARLDAVAGQVVDVPRELVVEPLPRSLVARDLENPRGMLPRENGELLVAVAGSGNSESRPTGALVVLIDENGDGAFEERRLLLEGQASRNIVDIVRRDEVFGMAGIAAGGGATLVSLAYFGGPSTIYRVDGNEVVEWSRVFGNINDLEYDPLRDLWVGVSSSSDEVVRLQETRGSRRILKVPPLPDGQDPVPGYLRHDPVTGDLLVSLFSGSTEGEEGGLGIEIVPRAGGIIRVDPETGDFGWLVKGLTAPTDLELGPDGRLYVLEFCSQFEQPVETWSAMWERPVHGGFRRFSGRLLAIDREGGGVTVVADGLDGPTNLALRGRDLYVAQGMGTPGRPIPGPNGPVPLSGFIERVRLPAPEDGA